MEEKILKNEEAVALNDKDMEQVIGGEEGTMCPYCKHNFEDSIGLAEHIAKLHPDK